MTSPQATHHADPELNTYLFRVGPFSIGGYQTLRHTDIVKPPPVKGSIVGMDVRVVDSAGDEIPQSQLMLCHNVFTNGGPDSARDDGACPHRSVAERFYGSSEELRPLTLPRGYGYPTNPQEVSLTLAQWRGRGKAGLIQRPAGAFMRLNGDGRVLVDDFAFKPALVSVPRGSTLSWRFRDSFIHDATVVRGPRGFAIATVRSNTERYRFTAPGEYKLHCSIHPVLMSQVVKVR